MGTFPCKVPIMLVMIRLNKYLYAEHNKVHRHEKLAEIQKAVLVHVTQRPNSGQSFRVQAALLEEFDDTTVRSADCAR